jgi:hypothetical protein
MNFSDNISNNFSGIFNNEINAIPVDTTLHHYNLFGIIIDYHYPISLSSWITAFFIIVLIILIKKYKIKKDKEEYEINKQAYEDDVGKYFHSTGNKGIKK